MCCREQKCKASLCFNHYISEWVFAPPFSEQMIWMHILPYEMAKCFIICLEYLVLIGNNLGKFLCRCLSTCEPRNSSKTATSKQNGWFNVQSQLGVLDTFSCVILQKTCQPILCWSVRLSNRAVQSEVWRIRVNQNPSGPPPYNEQRSLSRIRRGSVCNWFIHVQRSSENVAFHNLHHRCNGWSAISCLSQVLTTKMTFSRTKQDLVSLPPGRSNILSLFLSPSHTVYVQP